MTESLHAFLPYQQTWFADHSRVKMYTKSRRIGISWTEAADAALTAAKASGMNVTYICYDKDITKNFISDCAFWAKAYNLAASAIDEHTEIFRDNDEDKSCLIYTIHFASGHTIEAIAGTPRKLRGRKGRVIIDEAAWLDTGVLPEIMAGALALLIWGGDIRLITTYNGTENDYYELEQDVINGKLPYSRHLTTFREAIDQGLYKRICLVSGGEWSQQREDEFVRSTYADYGDKANQELDCIPANSLGAYIPRTVIEQCQVPAPILKWIEPDQFTLLPASQREAKCLAWIADNLVPHILNLNPHHRSYFGQDFGRSCDASVILPLQEDDHLILRCPFALEMWNIPHEQQRQVLVWLIDHLPRFISGTMDGRGNGNYLAETTQQLYGIGRIHLVQANQPWYVEWLPKYKAALQDKQIELPQSADWLYDHRLIELDKGKPRMSDKHIKGTDGRKRHGDGAIAGLNAWHAYCNASYEIDFQSDSPRSNLDDLERFSSSSITYF